MRGGTRGGRSASDAGEYSALSFFAVPKLWPVREVPPHFAKFSVSNVKEPNVHHGLEGTVN